MATLPRTPTVHHPHRTRRHLTLIPGGPDSRPPRPGHLPPVRVHRDRRDDPRPPRPPTAQRTVAGHPPGGTPVRPEGTRRTSVRRRATPSPSSRRRGRAPHPGRRRGREQTAAGVPGPVRLTRRGKIVVAVVLVLVLLGAFRLGAEQGERTSGDAPRDRAAVAPASLLAAPRGH